jgi:hypothetical protein
MALVGFETKTPAFEWVKALHVLEPCSYQLNVILYIYIYIYIKLFIMIRDSVCIQTALEHEE